VTDLTDFLAVGDLRSDGLANEVVRIVTARPELLPGLLDALASKNPAIRGHAADALEKVARARVQLFIPHASRLARQAASDEIPMVRWHLAMILGDLSLIPETRGLARRALLRLLRDPSPFVRSWAVTGLAIGSRPSSRLSAAAVRAISPLTSDPSPAVAKRARTAVRALTDPSFRLPESWLKTKNATEASGGAGL
jgi:HEAT repeat protein